MRHAACTILVVGAAAEDLAVAIGELAVQLAEGGDLGGADEGEVLGPEEVQLPLTGIGLFGDCGECLGLVLVSGDGGSNAVARKFFANLQHEM